MPEHDKEATDMQTIRVRAAVAKHTRVCQGLNDPQLRRPQQKQVSILDMVLQSGTFCYRPLQRTLRIRFIWHTKMLY